jgi:hypothetical protein
VISYLISSMVDPLSRQPEGMRMSGYLIGSMIDPLTWLPTFLLVFLAKKLPWWGRIGAAVLIYLAVVAIITSSRSGEPFNGRAFVFGVFAIVIWGLVALGIQNVWRKRGS